MSFGERHRIPLAWRVLLGLAAARVGLHLLIGSGYGIFRDEFYYLACGARPAWGYVDQPPLVPLLARLASSIWGYTTITAGELRLFSALAAAGVIFVTGLLAREIGGGRFAQGLAALAVGCAPLFLAVGDLFETVVFDQLCWVVTSWLILRTWARPPGAGWLIVGLVAGIGLETKYTMGLLGLGLAAALLLTAAGRQHLRTPWPWLGGLLALLVLAPNLWWQRVNAWPTAEFIHNNNEWNRQEWTPLKFLLSQLEFLSLAGFALAAIGLWRARPAADGAPIADGPGGNGARLWRRTARSLRRVFSDPAATGGPQVMGWIFLVTLAVLLVSRGKPYYLGPAFPPLVALGALAAEEWTARRSTQDRARDGDRRRWLRPTLVAGVIVLALPGVPIALPLIPPQRLPGSLAAKLQHDFGEMFGWQELTAQVEAVFTALPPADRAQAVVQTANYGEAAAIEHFGRLSRTEMPVASGHNNYALWKRGLPTPAIAVIIARQRDWLDEAYEQVEPVATIENSLHYDNEERGKGIYVCRRPRDPKRTEWAGGTYFQ